MNKFLVPQFIEVEAKIFGPITVRQFIIMIATMVIVFIEYKLMTFITFILVGIVTLGLGGVVAFLKINGQPFHYFLLNLAQTLRRPGLRVWKKAVDIAAVKKRLAEEGKVEVKVELIPHKRLVSSSHLEELSLVVNTGGAYQSIEKQIDYEESQK